jgi:peptidoglycan/xylan/chitin deacetylase (PgdA/CDA1 family)
MLVQSQKKKVPILMYHSISDRATRKFKQFTVSPALFAGHVAYLHQHAYTPITVTQFVNALIQKDSLSPALPERPVVLTFDDGFADFFTEALPVLRQFGFTGTLYVATAFINGTSCWLQREGETTRPMLTWEQLAEISTCGIECGTHTHSHLQLDTLSISEAQGEIMQSKKLLEHRLGQKVSSLAYPYGYYTAAVRRLVQEAGFTSACAVKHTLATETTDLFALARLMVRADTTMDDFAALLRGRVSSVLTTIYLRTRTPAWQLARRASASVRQYLQGGQPAQ